MKKYCLLFVLLVVFFTACNKDDNRVFNESPDERLNTALTAYQSKLSGAQYGWKGSLTTGSGGIYTFYFKFNDSNRVKMLSSFDSTSAVTLKESSYRLKALQQPSLIFDTYSYLHVLSDPNGAVNGGATGAGLVSDFEFYFGDSATADVITLVGRFNGSKATLTRATQQEAAAFNTGQLAAGLVIKKLLTYYNRIVINGTDSTDVHINPTFATVAATDAQGNLLDSSKKTPYFLSLGGLGFAKPLVVGSKTITEISNISYNTVTSTITATAGGAPIVIKQVSTPIKVDVAAPYRWWKYSMDRSDYWGSVYGFHVNGVDDYFGVTKLAGYNYVRFYAKYNISGSTYYDAFVGVVGTGFLGQATYTPDPPPATSTTKSIFTTDGRIIFRLLGSFGAATSIFNSVAYRNLVASGSGYYLIQTDALSYDMVSAADGKTWVTWEW